MKINTVKHFLLDSLKSLKRNRTISTASMATVAATLFILGVFLLTILNVKQAIKEVESKVEVKVFLKDDISSNQKNLIESKIRSTEGFDSVTFESKNDALDKLKEQLGDQNRELTEGFDKENPLPSAYIVKVQKPEMVTKVVENLNGMDGIEKIKDGREIVGKITSITKTLRWVGLGIFIILIGVSLFLIGNTIKLTVYSRRREIGIMKYIGATDWFIRWPFIMEGLIIGFVGALAANVLLYYAYRAVYFKISSELIIMNVITPQYVLSSILWIFMLLGMFIGSLGSIMAIRKFLSV